jgi:hypothetical protein
LGAAEADWIRFGKVAARYAGGEGGDGFERRLIAADVEVVFGKQKFVSVERRHHSHGDQPVFVRVGEAAKEDAIDDAEDGAGGSNAQGCGKYGGEGESGTAG